MRVLIDCGAWVGDTLDSLNRKYGPFDRTYAFECHPKGVRKLNKRLKRRPESPFILIPKAVWTSNEENTFRLGKRGTSSTLLKNKKNLDSEEEVQVECIDFARWLLENCLKEDHLVVKMDIEGAEYPVLEHMIETRAIELVDVLLCEWHAGRRLPPKEESRARHRKLLEQLEKEKLKMEAWG